MIGEQVPNSKSRELLNKLITKTNKDKGKDLFI